MKFVAHRLGIPSSETWTVRARLSPPNPLPGERETEARQGKGPAHGGDHKPCNWIPEAMSARHASDIGKCLSGIGGDD